MATFCHFSTFRSLSSHKLFSLPLPSLNLDHHRQHHHHIIFGSSIKKPSAGRKVKSNADLCKDIREFLSAVGLPEDHVPSMKELSQYGRQDLANIVRRRGYKLIRELLATSTKTNVNGSDADEGLVEKQDTVSASLDELAGQNEKVKDLGEVFSWSREDLSMKDNISTTNIDTDLISDDQSSISTESSANSSLQEKVATFIQIGELDTIEGSGFDMLNENGNIFIESQNATEEESSSNSEKGSDLVLVRTDAAKILDGTSTLSTQQVAHPVSENHNPRNNCDWTEEFVIADHNDDLDAENREVENQAEINRLKFMLHQKELELSQLKQDIEKEKLALSVLQTKAETEISKAQKLISEKNAELHIAEEGLSGLEEVEIEYWGDGETVEVAGSFNGWHHWIKMDPHPAANIIEPVGSRKCRLWRTVLWLYPGIYEIKFIVDGHWRVDPQRESTTRGTIHNNILRVNR